MSANLRYSEPYPPQPQPHRRRAENGILLRHARAQLLREQRQVLRVARPFRPEGIREIRTPDASVRTDVVDYPLQRVMHVLVRIHPARAVRSRRAACSSKSFLAIRPSPVFYALAEKQFFSPTRYAATLR